MFAASMATEGSEHLDAMAEAIRLEGEAHRALLAGDDRRAGERLREAARRYRTSWELAPPRSYGRLIGMLKALVIAEDEEASAAAAYVREQVGEQDASPPAWYALAIAALVDGDDDLARRAADGMRSGPEPFQRAAGAIDALARGDADAYAAAAAAIVADFEGRAEHLTGVPIADTALMLERLAQRRGLAAHPASPLLPAV
jgi:hypothetical protein